MSPIELTFLYVMVIALPLATVVVYYKKCKPHRQNRNIWQSLLLLLGLLLFLLLFPLFLLAVPIIMGYLLYLIEDSGFIRLAKRLAVLYGLVLSYPLIFFIFIGVFDIALITCSFEGDCLGMLIMLAVITYTHFVALISYWFSRVKVKVD